MRINLSTILLLMTMAMAVATNLQLYDQTEQIADPNDSMEDIVTRNLQNVVFYAPTCPKSNNVSLYDGKSLFVSH